MRPAAASDLTIHADIEARAYRRPPDPLAHDDPKRFGRFSVRKLQQAMKAAGAQAEWDNLTGDGEDQQAA